MNQFDGNFDKVIEAAQSISGALMEEEESAGSLQNRPLLVHMWSNTPLDEHGDSSKRLPCVQDEPTYLKRILEHTPIRFRSEPATKFQIEYGMTDVQIFHFSGHGFKVVDESSKNDPKNDMLAFEYHYRPFNEKMGRLLKFSVQDILKLNSSFKPQLVCVCACHSEAIGNAFVKIGVEHVIAVKRSKYIIHVYLSMVKLLLFIYF
jgi:hypothetical protein